MFLNFMKIQLFEMIFQFSVGQKYRMTLKYDEKLLNVTKILEKYLFRVLRNSNYKSREIQFRTQKLNLARSREIGEP